MTKGQALARKTHFNEVDLSRKIEVEGKPLPISEATAEEFDIWIYQILGKMYKQPGHIQNRYETSFDYDWSYPHYRIIALNEMYALNLGRVRACPSKPKIPLFAEEKEQVNVTL
jgi:hypothetical protein